MRKSNWLQDLKWTDVAEYLKTCDVIMLPVGSTEQHATHMPLGTDTYVAIGLSQDAAERTGVLIAPPLWYGWSVHHMQFSGSITVRPEILTSLTEDISYSLISHGFKKIVIINGHAQANLPPLHTAAVRVRNRAGAILAVVDPWDIGSRVARELMEGPPGSMGHATQHECSHMLHLHPDLIDMTKAPKMVVAQRKFHVTDHYLQEDRVYIPKTMEEFRKSTEPSGAYGDATLANPEKGAKYHRYVVDNIVQLLEELKAAKVELKDKPLPI